MTNPLKKAPFRALLLLLAGALTSVCVYAVLSAVVKYESDLIYDRNNFYIHSEKYDKDMNELYTKLWAVGNMYLANRSDSGDYIVNEYMQEQIEGYLREHDIMDDAGNITIGEYSDLEYIVTCNSMSFTNTGKSLEELEDCEYGIWQHDSSVSCDADFNVWLGCDGKTTNWGKTIYVIGHRQYAVYSFDTEGLGYYYDRYYAGDYYSGTAKNYYKTDGSTPLPSEGSTIFTDSAVYFIHSDEELEDILALIAESGDGQEAELFRVDDYGDTTGVYDLENAVWIDVPEEEYYLLSNDLYICIAPSDMAVKEYSSRMSAYLDSDTVLAKWIVFILIFAFAVLVLAIIYFVYCGYDIEEKCFRLSFLDKVYTEIMLGALATIAFGTCVYLFSILDEFAGLMEEPFIRAGYSAGYGIICITAVYIVGSIINRLKCRKLLETTLVFLILRSLWRMTRRGLGRLKRAYRSIGQMSHNAYFRRHLLRYIVGGVLMCIILIIFAANVVDGDVYGVSALMVIALYIVYVILDMRDARAIAKLSRRIERIRAGDYAFEQPDKMEITYRMQEDLNSISSGVSEVVEEQIRSERMKIDLVTNVSHDLKTPLTSIISYVDLLSKEELPGEAEDYVKILVNKTQRLNTMISDLFDLAKATSETDVRLEQLDAVILVKQVLADMEDKIRRYDRDIRTQIEPASVKVIGEGKKLYRVVQNVIDNALKYSLDHTRIYMTVTETETEVFIVIKNISSYEMSFTGDEIVERFARGDKSRTSEGNGLGLSIAKSFTQACGGDFNVIPEGDVFTAEIRLKKVPDIS